MNIQQDYEVIEKYKSGKKRKYSDIEEIVIHHTAGSGDWNDLKRWIIKGERKELYKKGIALFHFLIDKEGLITKCAPLNQWFYHSTSGKHDKHTIGIELIHKEPDGFTKKQYESLSYLISEFLPGLEESINVKMVVSHDYNGRVFSNKIKGCPGNKFDWEKLIDYLTDKDLTLTQIEKDCYIIED